LFCLCGLPATVLFLFRMICPLSLRRLPDPIIISILAYNFDRTALPKLLVATKAWPAWLALSSATASSNRSSMSTPPLAPMPPLSPASAHSAASAADLSLQSNRDTSSEGFVPFARSLQHNNTIQRLWWATLRRVNCSSPSRLTDSDNGPRPHFSAAISLDRVLNYDVAPEGVAAFTRALAVNRSLVSLECVADR